MIRAGILSWDWRGQPNLDQLRRILGELGGLSLHEVDTGSDQYAIVIAESSLSTGQVAELHDAHEQFGATILTVDTP